MDPLLIRKLYAAAFCVLLSCVGMTSGWRWLTVLALGLWIATMIVYGRGARGEAVSEPEPASSREASEA